MALTNEDSKVISQLLDEKLDQKLDEKLDQKLDEKLVQKFDERLAPINESLDKIDSRLDVVEYKQDRTAKKLDNLRLDIAVSERDIRRDLFELKDQMETVIEILKQNELIPA